MIDVAAPLRDRVEDWLGMRASDDVLRTLFAVMLTATASVLVLDYWALNETAGERSAVLPALAPEMALPDEPAAKPNDKGSRAPLWQPDARLQKTMSFDLQANGKLLAAGTIMPGTAKAFADEIDKRGGYVKTVVLDSPGGSLQDALAIGRLIRERKFATEVENGRACASACPLIFAGGVERRAAPKAAIGVHRAVTVSAGAPERDGMQDGQRVSALAQKYLREMGVDSAVWIHAMETPHNRLYTFDSNELLDLKLATEAAGAKRAEAKARS